MGKIIIRVPATVSNLGPGIDSLGLALHLYYTVIVEEETDHWRVNHALGENIPHDEHNLIVQTILRLDPKIHPHQLTVMSDIPVEHGLGSSTTAVIVGIKIANALGNLDLSIDEQMQIGNQIEAHSENVAAGFLGDLTVSKVIDGKLIAIKSQMPDVAAMMFVMPRGKVGKIELPKQIDGQSALDSSNDANLLVAALLNDNWPVAAKLIDGTYFGERNLKRDQDNLNLIKTAAHQLGIYGTFISGTGPVIVSLGKRELLLKLRDQLRTDERLDGRVRVMDLDRDGATVRGE
ncbi:homoserine kinase [Nicoliella spurrieriana]|uniref:Homoserine kinase n=1 Tax=Nicoliella spurrieriana TaxID=2925830 RepID=A0A976RSG9_9LACO|nr:homoserine kinase [Nicoliella spurrieriana]UQS87033.1 homoserine kinase [Nicoliella spurrieriana]